jgi:hypothetical protein
MGKISWGACPGKPVQPSAMKHTSLVGPFVSYEENEVL